MLTMLTDIGRGLKMRNRSGMYDCTLNVSDIKHQLDEQGLHELVDRRFRLLGCSIGDNYIGVKARIHNDIGKEYDWYENCGIEYIFGYTPRFIVGKYDEHDVDKYPIESYGKFSSITANISDIREAIEIYVTNAAKTDVEVLTGSVYVEIHAGRCIPSKTVRVGLNSNLSEVNIGRATLVGNLDIEIVNLLPTRNNICIDLDMSRGSTKVGKLTLERVITNDVIKTNDALEKILGIYNDFGKVSLNSIERVLDDEQREQYKIYTASEEFRNYVAEEYHRIFNNQFKEIVLSNSLDGAVL